MPTIHHLRFDDLDYTAKSVALLELEFQVWPPANKEAADIVALIEKARLQRCHHFVIFQEAKALAIATLSVREIFTVHGPLRVGALAGVCTHPDYRGRGWGHDVVRAAFDFMPQLLVEVALFQTPIPDFYARLGARLVSNRFHNGSNPDDPFHDPYKMIFPVTFDWPDGEIDLNGPGY